MTIKYTQLVISLATCILVSACNILHFLACCGIKTLISSHVNEFNILIFPHVFTSIHTLPSFSTVQREADVSVTCSPDPMFNPDGLLMPDDIGGGSSTDGGVMSGSKKRKRRSGLFFEICPCIHFVLLKCGSRCCRILCYRRCCRILCYQQWVCSGSCHG